MFHDGKNPIEVAIELGLPPEQISKLHKGYLDLKGRGDLNSLYKRCGDKILDFEKIAELQVEIETQTQKLNGLRSAYQTEYDNYSKLSMQLGTMREDLAKLTLQKAI